MDYYGFNAKKITIDKANSYEGIVQNPCAAILAAYKNTFSKVSMLIDKYILLDEDQRISNEAVKLLQKAIRL